MSTPPDEQEFLTALGEETLLDTDLIRKLGWTDEKFERIKDALLRREKIERIGPYKLRAKEVVPLKYVVPYLEPCTKKDIMREAKELFQKYKYITKKAVSKRGVVYETPKWTVFNWRAYLLWACRKYGSYLTPFSDEEYHDPQTLRDYDTPEGFVEANLKFKPPEVEDYSTYKAIEKQELSERRTEELQHLADELSRFRRKELREADVHLLTEKQIRTWDAAIKQARKQRDEAKRTTTLKDKELD
ncbi:unnamed protein product, partial [marine sediment metagenome]